MNSFVCLREGKQSEQRINSERYGNISTLVCERERVTQFQRERSYSIFYFLYAVLFSFWQFCV